MKLFGLTGGIGTGKSTAAAILQRRGLPILDTDVVARQLVEPGQPALAEIAAVFGTQVVDGEGKLRRGALAQLVFASPEKLKQLEAILHPRIREVWLKEADGWRNQKRSAGGVVIPLLFETNAQAQFDSVVCTACSTTTQFERLRARGWPDEQIRQRLTAQWPLEKKIAAANYVVWTETDLEHHEQQLERILGSYLSPRL
jgi:dephospho-CoA kinase